MEEKEYTGWKVWTPTDEELVCLYQEGSCPLDLLENEYLIILDRTDGSVAAVYKKKDDKLVKVNRASIKINDPKDGRVKKVYNPRNPEQVCAFDLLHDDSITVKLITGRFGSGKAIPNSTLIPTPKGFIKMGELRVGDYVFGPDGKPTQIIGVFPQGKKDVYEISFVKDNRKALCCEEHLWQIFRRSHGNLIKDVLTVRQMMEHGVSSKKANGQWNNFYYQIPITQPVQYPTKNFDIDPYIIGSFIGNGCNTLPALTLSSNDKEQIKIIQNLLHSPEVKTNRYAHHFRLPKDQQTSKNKNYQTQTFFRNYPELLQKSHLKRIPYQYLYGDIEQRFSLLQGLLDTDGTCSKTKGKISYSTTSKGLVDDILTLCYSLGLCASYSIDHRRKWKNSNICYSIMIQTTPENKINLFRLNRKKQRCVESLTCRQKHQRERLTIKSIKKLDYQEEMTCIFVDNCEHLFLINDYIVTHNTMMLVTAALEALKEKRYEKIVWIRNNIDVKDTKDLGALPGNLYEKAEPFLGPFIDHVGDKLKVEKMIHEGQLEIQPLQFLRGRNIENAIIMCSESQNMTRDHLALIISRAAEGSAVWLDGDFKQFDKTAFEKSKGLETLIKKLSGDPLFGYVKLIKTERSATAALADKLD